MPFTAVGFETSSLVLSITTPKTLTVPSDQYWRVVSLHMLANDSAVAGNRGWEIFLLDAAANYLTHVTWGACVASTGYQLVTRSGVALAAGTQYGFGVTPFYSVCAPWDPIILSPGAIIQALDINSVDGASDQFSIAATYEIWRWSDTPIVNVQAIPGPAIVPFTQ